MSKYFLDTPVCDLPRYEPQSFSEKNQDPHRILRPFLEGILKEAENKGNTQEAEKIAKSINVLSSIIVG